MNIFKPNNITKFLRLRNALNSTFPKNQISNFLNEPKQIAQIHNKILFSPVSGANMIVTRDFSSTAVIDNDTKNSFFKRILKKAGFNENSRARLRGSSILLYECVADKVNYFDFFKQFELPDTFNSWFLVTELHVWMLLVRSMAEGSEKGEDGRFLRNCIVEAMWTDVGTRAKKLGADNPSSTRAQIEVLSEQFQATLITYDEGIMSDDKILANALWRRFFSKKCSDYAKLELLVKYVRQQVNLLDSLEREEFLKPTVKWSKLE